jgi:hypothetical protein
MQYLEASKPHQKSAYFANSDIQEPLRLTLGNRKALILGDLPLVAQYLCPMPHQGMRDSSPMSMQEVKNVRKGKK